MSKKQERQTMISELGDYIAKYGTRIVHVTMSQHRDTNGNRKTTAKFYIVYPDGIVNITRHVAAAVHGRYSKSNNTVTINGNAHHAIEIVSELLYADERTLRIHHELN